MIPHGATCRCFACITANQSITLDLTRRSVPDAPTLLVQFEQQRVSDFAAVLARAES